jgi:UDP-N-acetylglucosamine 2-epimerase (non-hydrolysing)
MRTVSLVGARPNFVKMAPVVRELRRRLPHDRHVLVHTGQHYDELLSRVFIEELELPEPDHVLGVGSGTHSEQTARILERLEPVLVAERPDLVIVSGDVNSTLGGALTAAQLQIPLAHVESGLRSFDPTMPEELNRTVTDQLSDLLFVHSEEAIENLRREGVPDARIHFVGNTMIDTLVAFERRFRPLEAARTLGLEPGSYLLVTLHRPPLVDTALLDEVVRQLERLSDVLPVVFPVHPRTRRRLSPVAPGSSPMFVDPVGYLEFLSLEADARAVLTDSGGVQEETTYLDVPCFTLRNVTERPVTVRAGTNTVLGLEPERIATIPAALEHPPPPSPARPPLWDGAAAERVVGLLERFLLAISAASG